MTETEKELSKVMRNVKSKLALPEEFMRHLRWITPLLLTLGIWIANRNIDAQKETRDAINGLRGEMMAYTDKMIEVATIRPHADSVTKEEFKDFKGQVHWQFNELKKDMKSEFGTIQEMIRTRR